MIYAVDFDGTLCVEDYPNAERPKLNVINYIKRLQKQGHTIILWTCRVEPYLSEAVEFCKRYGLEFDYINNNSKERIKLFKNDCRKIYADYYIDDKAVNVKEIL